MGIRSLPLAHPVLVAIAQHEGMPGAARRRMVRDILRAYAELEERASEARTRMDVARWEVIGEVAIHAAWRQAGEPTGADGEPLRTLAELDAWFRRNGSRQAEAWQD